MDWKQEIIDEGQAVPIEDLGQGWWLFQRVDGSSAYYNGLLGWDYTEHNGYFIRHNPEKWIEHKKAMDGLHQDRYEQFTDGRQLKWIVREFMPPSSREYTQNLIKNIGLLTDQEIAMLKNIREKLYPYQASGTPEHKETLKIARKNRERIKRKWDAGKGLTKKPVTPPMPEHVEKKLKLLQSTTK